MPLVTSKQLMLDAQKGGYAIGAFGAENMEMIQAVIEAAEEMNSPVIIQTTPSTVRYASVEMYRSMVHTIAQNAKVQVVIHLDHGDSFDLCKKAIEAQYTSVMIDGSKLSFVDNVSLTKSVVDLACEYGIPVEGELGTVGGKEDDHVVNDKDALYTNPKQAQVFVEKTGVDALAVAIGTAHGFYKETPILDIERLKAIKSLVDIPLVLHGASGVPDEAVTETIKWGICKVNYATELRAAYTEGVKKLMNADSGVIDPKKYGATGRDSVKELVKAKILVCGSNGKALLYINN